MYESLAQKASVLAYHSGITGINTGIPVPSTAEGLIHEMCHVVTLERTNLGQVDLREVFGKWPEGEFPPISILSMVREVGTIISGLDAEKQVTNEVESLAVEWYLLKHQIHDHIFTFFRGVFLSQEDPAPFVKRYPNEYKLAEKVLLESKKDWVPKAAASVARRVHYWHRRTG